MAAAIIVAITLKPSQGLKPHPMRMALYLSKVAITLKPSQGLKRVLFLKAVGASRSVAITLKPSQGLKRLLSRSLEQVCAVAITLKPSQGLKRPRTAVSIWPANCCNYAETLSGIETKELATAEKRTSPPVAITLKPSQGLKL